MQVTVVTADNVVIVDGEGYRIDCSDLVEKGITAIQWQHTDGHIEYRTTRKDGINSREPNLLINEFRHVQPYAMRWSEEKTRVLQEQARLIQARLNTAERQAKEIQESL